MVGIKVGPRPRPVPGAAGGLATRSWSASRTRRPGWRTCVTTASGSTCPRPRRTCTRCRGWQPMREYTALALAGETAKAAEVAATLDRCGRWRPSGCRATARRRGIASIKAWAGLPGMSGGPVRPPLAPRQRGRAGGHGRGPRGVGSAGRSGRAPRGWRSSGCRRTGSGEGCVARPPGLALPWPAEPADGYAG